MLFTGKQHLGSGIWRMLEMSSQWIFHAIDFGDFDICSYKLLWLLCIEEQNIGG